MYFRMAVLILGIFCVGTAELSPSGMLGELSRDLSVTIPTAGLLVTVYALTVVIGGPVVTAITTRVRRKYLLVLLLLVSVAGNITCAFAPTFELLLVGRMITAVIQGTFMAVCVVTAGNMADGGKKGSAVAGTQLGVKPGDSARGSLRHARRAADRLAGHPDGSSTALSRVLRTPRSRALLSESWAQAEEAKPREWAGNDPQLTHEAYVAGEPCRACGRDLLGEPALGTEERLALIDADPPSSGTDHSLIDAFASVWPTHTARVDEPLRGRTSSCAQSRNAASTTAGRSRWTLCPAPSITT